MPGPQKQSDDELLFKAHGHVWRAHIFMGKLRLTTQAIQTRLAADLVLEQLLTLPGVTGGSIEVLLSGDGWVLEDEPGEVVGEEK